MTKNPFFAPVALLGFLALIGVALWLRGDHVFWPGYAAIMVFYAVIFGLGIFASRKRKTENSDDVILAGRGIPLWIAIFTMSATWIDGGYINGTAEQTSRDGLVWVQGPWGYALSLILGGIFFARIMRRHKFTTMLDPLEQRFGKRMAAVLFLPALSGEIFWTSAILVALGNTFATVLGVDMQTAIILSAGIAIVYTSIGGLWAMAYTDVFQMAFIIIGLVIIVPFAVQSVGGIENMWQIYSADKGAAAYPYPTREALGDTYWQWWDYALLLVFGGIPWQVYFQRVLAAKDENTAVRLSIFAGVLCLIVAIPCAMIGMVGYVFPKISSWASVGAPDLQEVSITLPYVVRYLTPSYIATLGLGVVAAAVMSSVDASMLSASSMASWNVYKPLVKPNISAPDLSKVVKRFIWIVGITATLLALSVKSVYTLWTLCSDFVYCLLFPQLVCALFDKKANMYGSVAAFAVGFILRFGGGDAVLGLPEFLPYPDYFPFRTLSMVSSLLTLIIVSRLTQKMNPTKPLQVVTEVVGTVSSH